ncbi:MAG: 50S ribosomal protein L13 [Candidatus Shapirobacteria bacterium]|jgi:large subunit ribosomal protein L13
MKPKTTVTKGNIIKREWHLVDLKDQVLGRVCVELAKILQGKDKPDYSPNRDAGDYVVAINADKIRVTGKKLTDKIYYNHTGYAGHLKELSLGQMMEKDSRLVIARGVKGMLPKNKLRDRRMTRLKIFVDSAHTYNDKIK